MWDVDLRYVRDWLGAQDVETQAAVFAALEVLEVEGPNLKRPLVATLSHTRIANLKELRPASPEKSEIRILFAFDPLRTAVMLFAGNKAPAGSNRSTWNKWYRKAIPTAEKRFEEHCETLKEHREFD